MCVFRNAACYNFAQWNVWQKHWAMFAVKFRIINQWSNSGSCLKRWSLQFIKWGVCVNFDQLYGWSIKVIIKALSATFFFSFFLFWQFIKDPAVNCDPTHFDHVEKIYLWKDASVYWYLQIKYPTEHPSVTINSK